MIEVIGHRGIPGLEPENTLRGFRKAIELGVTGIELDVRVTRDGIPVVIHDSTVRRSTNGRGRVSKMTLKEIKKLDAGKGESVPTLEEVLKEFGGKVYLHIEVKMRVPVKHIVQLVKKYELERDVCISSFSHKKLREVKLMNPHIATAVLFRKARRRITRYTQSLGAEAIHLYYSKCHKGLVNAAHRAGLKVRVYRISDEVAKMKKSLLWKVDGIMLDRPDILSKLVRK